MIIRTFALLLLYCSLPSPGFPSPAPTGLASALRCMSPAFHRERRFLKLGNQNRVVYRYHVGGIPNTSQERSPYREMNLVFYSQDRSRAIVATGIVTTTDYFLMVSDEYLARRIKGKWWVEEGQGGIGTYERVGLFITSIESTPSHVLTIRPIDRGSCVDESEWNMPHSKFIARALPAERKTQ